MKYYLLKETRVSKDNGKTIVVPISTFSTPLPQPRFRPSDSDKLQELRRELSFLQSEIKRLNNKVQFIVGVLHYEIEFWKRGIEHNEWETYDQIRRRVSRLKGATEYRGFTD